MRMVHSKRMEQRLPGIPTSSLELLAAQKGDQSVRILIVDHEAFLLTYVWHLTTFFERVCPSEQPKWKYWSYAGIAQPLGMATASQAVGTANWVVFCQSTPTALPSYVQRGSESWLSQEREPRASVGFFDLTGDEPGDESKAQVFLRKLARKENRVFVAVRDCLWGDRGTALPCLTHPQTRLRYE